jgi:hypothetical protein
VPSDLFSFGPCLQACRIGIGSMSPSGVAELKSNVDTLDNTDAPQTRAVPPVERIKTAPGGRGSWQRMAPPHKHNVHCA